MDIMEKDEKTDPDADDLMFSEDIGDLLDTYDPDAPGATPEQIIHARAIRRHDRTIARRAWGEKKLAGILGDLEPGITYHILSGGDIDSLSYLMHILQSQNLDYCLFSTWCMAMPDILLFEKWLQEGKIKRLDAYVGEIFINSYTSHWVKLSEVLKRHGGRICVFRNHAKIFAGTGPKFSFSIESSANINTNPRTENTSITISDEMFRFYKEFYDGIISFDRTFDEWEKWTA
jgi:hypothetical protein